MKRLNILLAIFFVLIYSNIYSQPEWYINPPLNRYPSELYFVGLGASKVSYDKAIEQAVSDIAKQIESNVRAVSKYKKFSERWGDKELISDYYRSSSLIFSAIEIKGYEVVKRECVNNEYYAMVVLEKSKFVKILRDELKVINNKISSLLSSSQSFFNKGEINIAMEKIFEIMDLIYKGEDKIELLAKLGNLTEDDKLNINEGELESIILEMISSIKIEKVSGDNQQAYVGDKLQPFVVRVSDKNGHPIKGVMVGFDLGYGEDLKIKYTDKNGEASYSMIAQRTSEDGYIIIAKLVLPFPPKILRRIEDKIEVDFKYIGKPRDLGSFSLVIDAPFYLKEQIYNKISNKLKDLGINIKDKCRRKIKVKFYGKVKSEITSMTRLVLVEGSLNISLYNGTKKIKSIELKFKGFGNGEKDAFSKAISSIKLKDNVLISLFSNSKKIEKIPVVAIVGFEKNNVYYINIENILYDYLVDALLNTGNVDIIDRESINEILKDMALAQAGVYDESTIKELGKFVQADYFIKGNISFISDYYVITAKLINVETLKVEKTAKIRISSLDRLRYAMEKIAEQISP